MMSNVTNITSNFSLNVSGPAVLAGLEDPRLIYSIDIGLILIWYVLAGIVLLGVIGNLLAFIVLSRYRHKTGTTYILTFLALVDMFVVISQLLRITFYEARWIDNTVAIYIFHLCLLHFQIMSIWSVVYLSLDRYIAICHPYSAIRMCSVGRAKRGIIIIFIASFVYYSFRTYDLLFASQEVKTKKWYSMMNFIQAQVIDTIIIVVVPLILLFFLNIRLMLAINRARRRRLSLSNGPGEKKNAATRLAPTINVVAVVTLFLITQVPNAIIFFVLTAKVITPHHHTILYLRLHSAKNILIGLNSSLNFLIYCLFYRKFREQVKSLFRCGRGFRRMGRDYESHYKLSAATVSTRMSLASEQASELL